jgi:hypothetical protein
LTNAKTAFHFSVRHLARCEAASGYICVYCVYDTGLGLYRYTMLIDGELVSTGVSIAQPSDGVRSHLKEAPEVRNRKFLCPFQDVQRSAGLH